MRKKWSDTSQCKHIISKADVLASGNEAGLALPYRGQAKAVLPPDDELAAVPEGVCRDVLIRSRMVRGVCSTHAAVPHSGLGLPGYVQVTSPIRRYTDLVAHWQLKARLSIPLIFACAGSFVHYPVNSGQSFLNCHLHHSHRLICVSCCSAAVQLA